MIGKEKSDFSFRISWHLYAHKCSNQFVSYIQLKLLFLSIETTVAANSLKLPSYNIPQHIMIFSFEIWFCMVFEVWPTQIQIN